MSESNNHLIKEREGQSPFNAYSIHQCIFIDGYYMACKTEGGASNLLHLKGLDFKNFTYYLTQIHVNKLKLNKQNVRIHLEIAVFIYGAIESTREPGWTKITTDNHNKWIKEVLDNQSQYHSCKLLIMTKKYEESEITTRQPIQDKLDNFSKIALSNADDFLLSAKACSKRLGKQFMSNSTILANNIANSVPIVELKGKCKMLKGLIAETFDAEAKNTKACLDEIRKKVEEQNFFFSDTSYNAKPVEENAESSTRTVVNNTDDHPQTLNQNETSFALEQSSNINSSTNFNFRTPLKVIEPEVNHVRPDITEIVLEKEQKIVESENSLPLFKTSFAIVDSEHNMKANSTPNISSSSTEFPNSINHKDMLCKAEEVIVGYRSIKTGTNCTNNIGDDSEASASDSKTNNFESEINVEFIPSEGAITINDEIHPNTSTPLYSAPPSPEIRVTSPLTEYVEDDDLTIVY